VGAEGVDFKAHAGGLAAEKAFGEAGLKVCQESYWSWEIVLTRSTSPTPNSQPSSSPATASNPSGLHHPTAADRLTAIVPGRSVRIVDR
jgi:hypothetical protein